MTITGNVIQSPLNYTGGKYKLLPQLLPLFPDHIGTFVDLMCGGCNVGLNINANTHIYNDSNHNLLGLYKILSSVEPAHFIESVYDVINKYNLSLVSEHGYDFYGCGSGKGLSKYNKDKYTALREDFNNRNIADYQYFVMLYVLIVYGFNNQIRFNSRNEFNLPVGKRDFNEKMKLKLISFIETVRIQKAQFTNLDFREFDFKALCADDFVYADPPYLITCASYNEQNGWNESLEKDLLKTLDAINDSGIRFALSNVLESKGKSNDILSSWADKNGYKIISLDYSYRNANYHRKAKDSVTKEVLVVNY